MATAVGGLLCWAGAGMCSSSALLWEILCPQCMHVHRPLCPSPWPTSSNLQTPPPTHTALPFPSPSHYANGWVDLPEDFEGLLPSARDAPPRCTAASGTAQALASHPAAAAATGAAAAAAAARAVSAGAAARNAAAAAHAVLSFHPCPRPVCDVRDLLWGGGRGC